MFINPTRGSHLELLSKLLLQKTNQDLLNNQYKDNKKKAVV